MVNADAVMTKRLDRQERARKWIPVIREWRDRQLERLGLERKVTFSGRVLYVPKSEEADVLGSGKRDDMSVATDWWA